MPQRSTTSALHVGQSLLACNLVAGAIGFTRTRHSDCISAAAIDSGVG
jgi:hypothetical protein